MTVLDQLRASLARTERVAAGLRQAIAPLEELETEALTEVSRWRLIEAPRGAADRAPTAATQGGRTRAARVAVAGQARSARPVGAGKGRAATPPPATGARLRPTEVKAGHRYCGSCETVKPRSEFGRNTAMKDGLQTRCRACTAASAKVARARSREAKGKATPPPTEKACTKCGKKKPATREHFYPQTAGRGGLHSQCIECHAKNAAARTKRKQAKRAATDEDGNPVETPTTTAIADREERRARIAARVKANGRRGKGFVRCLLLRVPDPQEQFLARAAVPCGAVVFAGDEGDHLDDVHGGAKGRWEPVDADQGADDEAEAA